jgi:hypothetical protein
VHTADASPKLKGLTMARKVMQPDELSQKATDHLFKAVNEENLWLASSYDRKLWMKG